MNCLPYKLQGDVLTFFLNNSYSSTFYIYNSSYGIIEWKEDLKKLMFMSGIDNKQCVFLFNDTQIKFESMLEDINNILNGNLMHSIAHIY